MDLGQIFSLIKFLAVEAELYLGAGTGPEKKKYVIDTINQIVSTLKLPVPGWVMSNLSVIIDLLVMFWNAIGAFLKGTKPATPSATK
jgi:hypothetical protein